MLAWVIGLVIGIAFSSIVTWKKYYTKYLLHVDIKKDKVLIRSFMKYSIATLIAGNIGATLSQIDMQLIIYIL
jgi:O-antigen/teichoic acid export membrane protein